MGVVFHYPAEWKRLENYKMLFDVDAVLLFKECTNFGIVRVSVDELKNQVNDMLLCGWIHPPHPSFRNSKNPHRYQYYHPPSYHPLAMALRSSIQIDEIILEDVIINKHPIIINKNNNDKTQNINSASILLSIRDDKSGLNLFHERTIVMYENNKGHDKNEDRCFMIEFVDLPDNFESGKIQSQLKIIFDSFRFI